MLNRVGFNEDEENSLFAESSSLQKFLRGTCIPAAPKNLRHHFKIKVPCSAGVISTNQSTKGLPIQCNHHPYYNFDHNGCVYFRVANTAASCFFPLALALACIAFKNRGEMNAAASAALSVLFTAFK